MRYHPSIPLLLAGLGCLFLLPAGGHARPPASPVRINPAVAKVTQALVSISLAEVDYEEGREVKQESFGSGVIVSEQGHVVTNYHVAGQAKHITCTLADRTELPAELVGADALTDIAVLRLLPEAPRRFTYARFGDSDRVKVGDRVFAMGSPLAFSQSVTMGIVSNTELVASKAFGEDWLTIAGEEVGSVVRWIAHDAAIYPGNSGGPLVNEAGEIVGINEIKVGLSGAIPGNLVRRVAEQIIKSGRVTRAWIGIGVQPLLRSSGRASGVLVSESIPGTPAAAAGIRPGDIITRVGGKPVEVRFKEELPPFNLMMMGLPVGEPVALTLLREGKEITLSVTPAARPESQPRQRELKAWGICASNVSVFKAKELHRGTEGVLVTSVRSGGPADSAEPALAQDDVIVEVAGKPVPGVAELALLTDQITKDQEEPVPTLVAFERNGERWLTVAKLGVQQPRDAGLEARKAWLPVATQVVTRDLAQALGLGNRQGVRITRVYPGSTADSAGLKVGDIIVALDGEPIPASRPEDNEVLAAMVRRYRIDGTATLTVVRDGQEQQITVALPAGPASRREMTRYRDVAFEFSARDLAFADRAAAGWEEGQQGALVEAVDSGGWASLGLLRSGDLITRVQGMPVTDVATLQEAMRKVAQDKPRLVVLEVLRGIHHLFLEVPASWHES